MDAVRDIEGGASMAFGFNSVISLSNLYGIEYADFAAETAKLALWIAEYQQNARFIAAFGAEIPALPLSESGRIYCGNALRTNWNHFCDVATDCKILLVGNPPYLGANVMSTEQREDMKYVFTQLSNNYKTLDYVCAWFVKASHFITGKNAKFAFVATNSITQGSQVCTLWPLVLTEGLEIAFAYKSFKWKNNALNNAGVTVVIIGVRHTSQDEKYLITEAGSLLLENINGYLVDAADVYVTPSKKPLNLLPLMQKGNQPTDGGHLILTKIERDEVVAEYPEVNRLIKKLLGSREIINGDVRYCYWIADDDLDFVARFPFIPARLERVVEMRKGSPDKGTRDLASRPHQFREFRCSDVTIGIPSVSSENREFLPAAIFDSSTILTNLALAIYDAEEWHFALVVSKLHELWIRAVCGQLETRIRYSSTLGWHTFPIPKLTQEQKIQLNESAREILLVRESYYPQSISDLYAKGGVPDNLMSAHNKNDQLLESFYRDEPFESDDERLAHLFERYVEMTNGVEQ